MQRTFTVCGKPHSVQYTCSSATAEAALSPQPYALLQVSALTAERDQLHQQITEQQSQIQGHSFETASLAHDLEQRYGQQLDEQHQQCQMLQQQVQDLQQQMVRDATTAEGQVYGLHQQIQTLQQQLAAAGSGHSDQAAAAAVAEAQAAAQHFESEAADARAAATAATNRVVELQEQLQDVLNELHTLRDSQGPTAAAAAQQLAAAQADLAAARAAAESASAESESLRAELERSKAQLSRLKEQLMNEQEDEEEQLAWRIEAEVCCCCCCYFKVPQQRHHELTWAVFLWICISRSSACRKALGSICRAVLLSCVLLRWVCHPVISRLSTSRHH